MAGVGFGNGSSSSASRNSEDKMNSISSIQLEQVKAWVNFYRGQVLDLVEQELADSPQWPFVRNKLLKIFGDRGLEEKVISILSPSSSVKSIGQER